MSPRILNYFGTISHIFQSVLTNQQIRTGKLWSTVTNAHDKPKLSVMINSIRLKASVHPLLLGFMSETTDLKAVVGVRCRCEAMTVDLRLSQRQVKPLKKDEPRQISRKAVSKWKFEEADADLTKLEMRTFSLEFTAKEETVPVSIETRDHIDMDWIVEEDFHYEMDINQAKLESFVSSPKLCYYLRNNSKEQANAKIMGN
jgi:hypothetical protein